jgi:hypothetical protein
MEISRYLHVVCVAAHCTAPADAHVPIPVVAPGVISYPTRLRCATCDCDLKVMDDAANAKQG